MKVTYTEAEQEKLRRAVKAAEADLVDPILQRMKLKHSLSCAPCRLEDERQAKRVQLARDILNNGGMHPDLLRILSDQANPRQASRITEETGRKARREAYERFYAPHVEMSRHSYHPEVLKAMGATNPQEPGLQEAVDQARRHREMQDEAVQKAMTVGGHPLTHLDAAQKEARRKKQQEIFDEAARRHGARR